MWPSLPLAHADGDVVDEIHYSFGDTPDSAVFDWHGQEQNIYYGLDTNYGSQAVASDPMCSPGHPCIPVDEAGPFREVALTGLQPGTVYHYKIGVGIDHTFQTTPTGDFNWVDVGDTGSTLCHPWIAQTHTLIAAQNPAFVTHGGDISYANVCGKASVHQYYIDQQAWSEDAAFQPAWGNHEYGAANPADGLTPPPGTPQDSMLNYKGRSRLPHAQTVPVDTTTKTKNPGCGWETASITNTCQGDDWGWFVASHVLFIGYPEPWTNAYPAWETAAAQLMANAQTDSNIDFIVTYGHRPAISSDSSQVSADLATAVNQLAQSYSPTPANPTGKYILNIGHHSHTLEAFNPINGLVNIVDGGGGLGSTSFDTTINSNSIWRSTHPGILSGAYSAAQHSLTVNMLCGPQFGTNTKDPCTYGATLYTQTFTVPSSVPAQPALTASLSDNVTNPQLGQQITYTVTATNQGAGSTATGVNATVTLPSNVSVVNANGGTVSGNTVSWDLGYVSTPAAAEQVVVQLQSGTAGDPLTVSAQLTATDASCQAPGSNCNATDSDTIVTPSTPKEWIGNQSFETSSTGWAGKYNTTSLNSRVAGGYDGAYSFRSVNNTSATGATGFIDNPHWLDGTAGKATAAGTTYTGTILVRADVANEKISLYLRELSPSGTTVSSKTVSITAANTTSWVPITNAYKAVGSGNSLGFYVYASSVAAHKGFNADLASLTSSN